MNPVAAEHQRRQSGRDDVLDLLRARPLTWVSWQVARAMLTMLDAIYIAAQADDPNPPKSLADMMAGLSDSDLVNIAGSGRFVAPEDRGDIR